MSSFPPGFTGRDGEPLPLIVRKRDGGYGYPATDLAALRYAPATSARPARSTSSARRSAQHFAMVFAVARRRPAGCAAGVAPSTSVRLVLGADGRMLRSPGPAGR